MNLDMFLSLESWHLLAYLLTTTATTFLPAHQTENRIILVQSAVVYRHTNAEKRVHFLPVLLLVTELRTERVMPLDGTESGGQSLFIVRGWRYDE